MARARTALEGNTNGKIMGKAGKSYTVEHLQRLLQEFGIIWTKQDNKSDLIAKLRKHVTKHPQLTAVDRTRILNSTLDVQPVRWQVLDENGNFKLHAYPPQIGELLQKTAESAVTEHNKDLIETNARPCMGCQRYVAELNFSNPIASCCNKASNFCRACVEKDIKTKVFSGGADTKINCPMCQEPLLIEDLKRITTGATFEKFREHYASV